jgi:hypothetical protein
MGPGEMSTRTHFWLRLAAVVVIVTSAWLPRGFLAGGRGASMHAPDGPAIHASLAR